MICRLCWEDADEGKWALGEAGAFDLSVSTESWPVTRTQKTQIYTAADIRAHRDTHVRRHTNTEGRTDKHLHTLKHKHGGSVCFSASSIGLTYWSQGSIAALPAAINPAGLRDAQTVYWSLQTMTKSHPSEQSNWDTEQKTDRAKDAYSIYTVTTWLGHKCAFVNAFLKISLNLKRHCVTTIRCTAIQGWGWIPLTFPFPLV